MYNNKMYELSENEKNGLNSLKIPIMVYQVIDKHLRTLFVNAATLDFFETDYNTAIALLDTDMYRFTHPEDKEQLLKLEEEVIKDPSIEYDVTYRTLSRSTDNYIWLNVKSNPVHLETGELLFYSTYVKVDEIEKESSRQDEFIAKMSHDMRTPLTAIMGYADLGIEESADAELKKYFDKIKKSGLYLLNLMNDVLDISNLDSSNTPIKTELVHDIEFFDELEALLQPKAAEKNIELKFSSNLAQGKYSLTSKKELERIFINIINNAIKYTLPEGHVTCDVNYVRIDGEIKTIRIAIADDGIGMSQTYIKDIFEPFTREQNSLSSSEGGSGLGMAIVKKLVERLSGTIEVESELGHGTTFTICVPYHPVSKEDYEKQKAIETNLDMKCLVDKRVLIVEDNNINAAIIAKILMKYRIVTERARDGEEAIQMYKANQGKYYDAILMDIRMPRRNGYEATQSIREYGKIRKEHVPIIALSANAYDEDRELAMKSGMDGFLTKPFEPQKMVQVLFEQINKSE